MERAAAQASRAPKADGQDRSQDGCAYGRHPQAPAESRVSPSDQHEGMLEIVVGLLTLVLSTAAFLLNAVALAVIALVTGE